MDINDVDALAKVQEHWRERIIQECETMHAAIESLRELAKKSSEEQFVSKIDDLHILYCELANTVTLRLLLNGAIATLGCEEKENDDSRPGA
jgi:hypothetical protein